MEFKFVNAIPVDADRGIVGVKGQEYYVHKALDVVCSYKSRSGATLTVQWVALPEGYQPALVFSVDGLHWLLHKDQRVKNVKEVNQSGVFVVFRGHGSDTVSPDGNVDVVAVTTLEAATSAVKYWMDFRLGKTGVPEWAPTYIPEGAAREVGRLATRQEAILNGLRLTRGEGFFYVPRTAFARNVVLTKDDQEVECWKLSFNGYQYRLNTFGGYWFRDEEVHEEADEEI